MVTSGSSTVDVTVAIKNFSWGNEKGELWKVNAQNPPERDVNNIKEAEEKWDCFFGCRSW